MDALLSTTYIADDARKKRVLHLPVKLLDVGFYANGNVVCVKVRYGDDLEPIWVSPSALLDACEHMPLDFDRQYGVWLTQQRIEQQQNPNIENDLNFVLRRIRDNELEDQDAFDAVEALGFTKWEADYIVNNWA